jgi:hypothetical protein
MSGRPLSAVQASFAAQVAGLHWLQVLGWFWPPQHFWQFAAVSFAKVQTMHAWHWPSTSQRSPGPPVAVHVP